MQIDRRQFTTGAAAGAVAISTPMSQALAAMMRAAATTPSGSVDLATCDPWLVQFSAGAPRLVIHEASGAVFRPRDVAGRVEFQFERHWANYEPPYALYGRRSGETPQDGGVALRELPTPARARGSETGANVDRSHVAAAIPDVLALCASQGAAVKGGEVWLLVRPTAEAGAARATRTWGASYGARTDQEFPQALRADLRDVFSV
jgi:hypothetical protein